MNTFVIKNSISKESASMLVIPRAANEATLSARVKREGLLKILLSLSSDLTIMYAELIIILVNKII